MKSKNKKTPKVPKQIKIKVGDYEKTLTQTSSEVYEYEESDDWDEKIYGPKPTSITVVNFG